MEMIKKVSIPFSGAMLGILALGNLLQSYWAPIRPICGVLGGIFFILLLLKFILFPKQLAEDFNNPVLASVLATFPMGFMLLCTYVKPFLGVFAMYLWFLAVLLHVALIVVFSIKYLVHFDIKKVFASWFIVYVGIAVAGVSAKAFEQTLIGSLSFWFGLIAVCILLVVVSIRYAKYPVPDPAKPIICIYAAPVSLCIAAYIGSVANKSVPLLQLMLLVSTALLLFACVKAFTMIHRNFIPAFAAFTFPFVISAIALKQSLAFLASNNILLPFGTLLVTLETLIATAFVAYVYGKFALSLLKK